MLCVLQTVPWPCTGQITVGEGSFLPGRYTQHDFYECFSDWLMRYRLCSLFSCLLYVVILLLNFCLTKTSSQSLNSFLPHLRFNPELLADVPYSLVLSRHHALICYCCLGVVYVTSHICIMYQLSIPIFFTCPRFETISGDFSYLFYLVDLLYHAMYYILSLLLNCFICQQLHVSH